MHRRNVRGVLVALAVAAFLGMLTAFNATKPRILVLHSADARSRWAAGVDGGVREALDANRRPVSVRWHRLGLTKQLGSPATGQPAAVIEAHRAIARFDPDIVIAVDDEANAAVARDYAPRRRPRVIYVSIDQPPASFGYDAPAAAGNVTGIAERLPLAGVRDAVLAIRQGRPAKIAAVGVDNDTGRAERSQVESFDWSPHGLVAMATVANADSWRQFVEQRTADADILLVLSYAGLDTAGTDGLVEWIEQRDGPLPIGLHAAYFLDGGGLAISPPPKDYGRRAMSLALAWLDTPGETPPVSLSEHFDIAIRQPRLTRRGVSLPPIYIEAARAAGSLD